MIGLGFLLLWPAAKVSGQELAGFQQMDSLTYSLYLQGNWKDLIKTGNEAINLGFDYYFLRMRMGIACFYRENYRAAAAHFEKALEFNNGDEVALDYLRKCYEWGGMEIEAAWLSKRFPGSAGSNSVVRSAVLSSGYAFSGNESAVNNLDLDGEANVYGEVIGNGDLFYNHTGITFSPTNYFRWYAGYTNLQVEKHQVALMSGTDTLNHRYKLRQNQFIGRFPVRIGQGWFLVPAMDMINFKDQPIMVSYEDFQYKYDTTELTHTDYIAALKIFRELQHWSLGASISYSNLNLDEQWQASLIAGVYPKGNLDLYAVSTISTLMENDEANFHFKQTAGAKVLSKLWLQGTINFGDLQNAHDENSLVVFNNFGRIVSRTTASAIILLSEKVILQFDYSFIRHEDKYLEYLDYESFTLNTFQYDNQHIMGGIKWKF